HRPCRHQAYSHRRGGQRLLCAAHRGTSVRSLRLCDVLVSRTAASEPSADTAALGVLGKPGREAVRRAADPVEAVAAAVCARFYLQLVRAAAAVCSGNGDGVDMDDRTITGVPAEPEFHAGYSRSGVEFTGG